MHHNYQENAGRQKHLDLLGRQYVHQRDFQSHKYSLTEIENMMPWERDIYVALLQEHIEKENLKRQQAEGVRKYG